MTNIWADNLIDEYTEGRQNLRKQKASLDMNDLQQQQDAKQINSMVGEMSFAIDWMSTGRQPGKYKGIDKRSVYQRNSFEAMDLIPDIRDGLAQEPEPLDISPEIKMKLSKIFSTLSLRERQCFILHKAQQLSMAEIALELNISKSAVQMYIKRAKLKVFQKN